MKVKSYLKLINFQTKILEKKLMTLKDMHEILKDVVSEMEVPGLKYNYWFVEYYGEEILELDLIKQLLPKAKTCYRMQKCKFKPVKDEYMEMTFEELGVLKMISERESMYVW